jgi:protein phosphatase
MSDDAMRAQPWLTAYGRTDVGKKREHNEDLVLVRSDLGVFVVADGAGGHNAGEVAAQLAVNAIERHFERTAEQASQAEAVDRFGIPNAARRLSAAVHRANKEVVNESRSSDQHKGMGTTVVAACYAPLTATMHIAHVGDSRCYRLREGHLEQLTRDHSLLNDVLEQRPDLDEHKLERLPKHVVTRALGMGPTVRVTLSAHPAAGGDRFLLCSDGLSSPVPGERIAELLAEDATPDDVARKLIGAAHEAGAPDNVAVLVIDVLGQSEGTVPVSLRAGDNESREYMSSEPELLILGIEELDLTEHLYSASDGLLEKVGKLAAEKRNK